MAYRRQRPWGKLKPPPGVDVDWSDPITQGMVVCMLLNEGSGKFTKNIARPQYSGAFAGGAIWRQNSDGKGVKFTTLTDTVVLGNLSGLVPDDYTIVCDTRCDDINAYGAMFPVCMNSAGTVPGMIYGGTNGDADNFGYYGGGASSLQSSFVADTKRHMLVMTRRTIGGVKTVFFYVDGVAKGSGTETANGNGAANFSDCKMAYWSAQTYNYVGQNYQVRIYNRPFSPSEALRIYNEPYAGIITPRIKMREGASSISIPKFFHQLQQQGIS